MLHCSASKIDVSEKVAEAEAFTPSEGQISTDYDELDNVRKYSPNIRRLITVEISTLGVPGRQFVVDDRSQIHRLSCQVYLLGLVEQFEASNKDALATGLLHEQLIDTVGVRSCPWGSC